MIGTSHSEWGLTKITDSLVAFSHVRSAFENPLLWSESENHGFVYQCKDAFRKRFHHLRQYQQLKGRIVSYFGSGFSLTDTQSGIPAVPSKGGLNCKTMYG
eukprot:765695-Hanusia_phi.AAC.3